MIHSRRRHIEETLLKRLQYSPVVTIQGPRQSGKSFLARHLIGNRLKNSRYVTFDESRVFDFASSNPDTFLVQNDEAKPLIIDEAQKVARIFDAIKYSVDEKRHPGRYLLLGSTEFSTMSRIRESLTGRMSRIRLFPFNLAESLKLPKKDPSPFFLSDSPRCSRKELVRYLDSGGFPGIFGVRDVVARQALMEDWIDLTVTRDAKQFPGLKPESALMRKILQIVCQHPEPTAGNMARALGRNIKTIHTHLRVLKELFVIHELEPFAGSSGKPLYFVCDLGIAHHFNAGFEKKLWTWLILEQLAQGNSRGLVGRSLSFYRTPKGKYLHLISEHQSKLEVIRIHSSDGITDRDFELTRNFLKRHPHADGYVLGPTRLSFPAQKIECYPWESLG